MNGKQIPSPIMAINGGSSSIRFGLYCTGDSLTKILSGKIERIGLSGTKLAFEDHSENLKDQKEFAAKDFDEAIAYLLNWFRTLPVCQAIGVVGHRIVHGVTHTTPEIVTQELLDELKRFIPYDPDHLPGEIALIEAFGNQFPQVPQVVCFDTAFHRTMPRVTKLLPIPRRYAAKGIERYGFHGISYSYLMEELSRLDPNAAKGRVILAHLGNGASLAAVRDGVSIDTSMSFTPTSGLVMSSRSGDLDPGLGYFLSRTENMSEEQFQKMVNHESGMLGVSETSSDVRDLLALEKTDERAADAIEMFCYYVKRWIGSFAAVLGGVDTLVFAGGIGENSSVARTRICEGLDFLGLELCPSRNALHGGVISREASRATIRIIRTDEELMIARSTSRIASTEL